MKSSDGDTTVAVILCENYNLVSSGGKVVSLLITKMWLARFYTQCCREDKAFRIELYKFCDRAQEGLKYLSYEHGCV